MVLRDHGPALTDARRLLDSNISEKAWQASVVSLAHYYRWNHYAAFDSRRSPEGWPDLTLWRPPHLIFRECKSETGRLTPKQRAVLDQLAACGQDVGVWRPSDWDEVRRTLRDGPSSA
jgi:hypothetical protein